jgi:hypothetical protein
LVSGDGRGGGRELGDGGELLRDAVFEEGEGGGFEAFDRDAVSVEDDDIEDDQARGGVDGGDVVAGGLDNLRG